MSEPITVLWLCKGLGRGGAEMLLVSLAKNLDSRRVRLRVGYALRHKSALVDDLLSAQVHVTSLGGDKPWTWVANLRTLLRDPDLDVVHTHSPVIAVAARLLAPRKAVLVHTEHNVWARYHVATRWANAMTFPRNRLVWAVSQGVACSIRSRRWAIRTPPPVEVVLHGVDPAEFHYTPEDSRIGLERLGLEKGPFTIGTVGNLTPKKDHDSLIRAFARHLHGHPSSRLVIVGGGPQEAHLRALVRRLKIESQVTLTGSRDDVPRLLAAFDLFVLSSSYEGLSIALVEAMGAGLPIVATSVGGIPEVVEHERHGLLVPPGDVPALTAAIDAMQADPDLRRRFAAAARERAADFGIEAAAATFTERYRQLTQGHPMRVAP